jgi:hypothetical protein
MRTVKFSSLTLATIAAMALTVGAANAGVYEFTLAGSGLSASGEFITSGTTSPYAVIDVTGTASDASYISTAPSPIVGVTGFLGADNLLNYPPAPAYVTGFGISFYTANDDQYNVGGGVGPLYYAATFGTLYYADYPLPLPVSLTVTPVPEAPIWILMALGFVCLGFLRLRGGKSASSADRRSGSLYLRPSRRSMYELEFEIGRAAVVA